MYSIGKDAIIYSIQLDAIISFQNFITYGFIIL